MRDTIVGITSAAVSIATFAALSSYAELYGELPQSKFVWPSDAPILEAIAVVGLVTILIFLPLNALVRNPQISIFRIGVGYWAVWISGFVTFVIWYIARALSG